MTLSIISSNDAVGSDVMAKQTLVVLYNPLDSLDYYLYFEFTSRLLTLCNSFCFVMVSLSILLALLVFWNFCSVRAMSREGSTASSSLGSMSCTARSLPGDGSGFTKLAMRETHHKLTTFVLV